MSIINTEKLAGFLTENDVVLIDARGGADAQERYLAGHLSRALFVDLETELSEKTNDASLGGRHPLPEPQTFGILLGKLGISPDSNVVIYDDKNGANAAARFWWMLKAAGHQNAWVVSGGLTAIQRAELDVTDVMASPASTYGAYPLTNWQLPVATIDELENYASDPAYLVIDVRENYRYAGESEPIDLVAGHIPGAINIPFAGNMDENGEFLSSAALRKKYEEMIQVSVPGNVIVHCGSGVTACHTLLAIAEAGLEMPRLYVGSWSEWSRRELPVKTGQHAQ